METKGTRVVSREVKDLEDGQAEIRFKVEGVGELILATSALSNEVRRQAMIHGLVQRISDAAALSRDAKTGKSASPEEKFKAMKVLVDHYASGTVSWNLAGGERGPSDEVRLLIEALLEVYPKKSKDELSVWTRKRSKEELAALMGQENLKAIMDRKRGERASGVDAEALLGELG